MSKILTKNEITKFKEDGAIFLKNKYKFVEIASSLSYYLKSFSNINKLLDYVCLIFKHIFDEQIILIIPLNYEGSIWNDGNGGPTYFEPKYPKYNKKDFIDFSESDLENMINIYEKV